MPLSWQKENVIGSYRRLRGKTKRWLVAVLFELCPETAILIPLIKPEPSLFASGVGVFYFPPCTIIFSLY
jgi:hypothetical protein